MEQYDGTGTSALPAPRLQIMRTVNKDGTAISVQPADYPITWYCYGMFAEPGTKVAIVTVVVVASFFVLSGILILASMGALIRTSTNRRGGWTGFHRLVDRLHLQARLSEEANKRSRAVPCPLLVAIAKRRSR